MIKVQRVDATSQVVDTIRKAIIDGDMKVGDRLPEEMALAKEIGVGRSSLREGIKILSAYGVVETRQGSGTFIVDNRAKNFFEFMGFLPGREHVDDFLELRRVIEVGNIFTIYDKLTEQDFNILQETIEVFKKRCAIDCYVEADKTFHSLLIEHSGNPMLIQINRMITQMRTDLLFNMFQYQEVIDDAREAHNSILSALRAKDLNACICATVDHLDTTVPHAHYVYDMKER